ncbi:MAG: hypothetical protein OXH56_11425 [Gemmatimonadetes bacterium]|nr:hypothetical protein [Gemmatimonadota bacterium]
MERNQDLMRRIEVHTFNTYESTIDPRAACERIAAVKAQIAEINETVQSC